MKTVFGKWAGITGFSDYFYFQTQNCLCFLLFLLTNNFLQCFTPLLVVFSNTSVINHNRLMIGARLCCIFKGNCLRSNQNYFSNFQEQISHLRNQNENKYA